MKRIVATLSAILLAGASTAAAEEATLRGSPRSMIRQHGVAESNEFTFLRSADQVERFVEKGFLVKLEGNDDYAVNGGVSYPYGRPVLRTFVERLAGQYRAACDEKLVVTSVTRPTSEQPRNSHPLSVHPAGMALDLRVSQWAACREWLEETLLSLELDGLLDVTREKSPPHYHVAVFPDAYEAYAAARIAEEDSARAAALALEARMRETPAVAEMVTPLRVAPRPERSADTPWRALAALPVLGSALAFGLFRRRTGGTGAE